jgi:hypothetical protein
MSEEKKEVGLLEQMKQQHQMYCQQRDLAQVNFQQLVGAIYALETMIKSHEDDLKKQLEAIAKGVCEDGQVNEQNQEETPQE